MNCRGIEDRISEYLEGQLIPAERETVDQHLQVCPPCQDLLLNVQGVLDWARAFPIFEPPVWLPARIIANTPRTVHETWLETLEAGWRWLVSPRTALSLFTSVLVLGWMGTEFGLTSAVRAIARDPAAAYESAGDLVNRAYDGAVRRYYSVPLVTEIQGRIERLRETS